MARVGRRLPYPGAPFELSALTLAAAPEDPAVDGAAAVALLRRAWNEGITTFDTVDVPNPAVAEMLLARAFPHPEPSMVVLSGRRGTSSRDAASSPHLDRRFNPPAVAPMTGPRQERGVGPVRRLIEIDAPSGGPTSDRSPSRSVRPSAEDAEVVVRCRSWEEVLAVQGHRRPGLVAVELSLLDRTFTTSAARDAVDRSVGWIVRDPFAGGRLDGSRFDRRLSTPISGPPPSVRDLEVEFGPVARFRFLSRPGRRTLAQAALRFVLDLPWVATVCVPMPRIERWEEVVGYADSAPLEEAERATIEALPEASIPGNDSRSGYG